MSVLVLSGSPSRTSSRSAAMLSHVVSRLRAASVPLDALSVRDLPAEDLIEVRREGSAAIGLRTLVARSRAIVVATPVYNASVPGGLKALLDLLPEQALHGKLVLPLASGGSAGHQLAIEYSLKPILSALGARHVLAGVFACDGDLRWSADRTAEPVFGPHLVARLDDASVALLALLGVGVDIGVDVDEPPPGLRSAASINPIKVVPSSTRDHPQTLAPERCSA